MKTRIPPAGPEVWSAPVRDILGEAVPASENPDGLGPPNILFTIAHHPALLGPFLDFSSTLALRGSLPRRDAELVALRTALNCRSPFEWGHHVDYGLAAGLAPSELERIAAGPEHPDWSARDRLLLCVCDELHAAQQLRDETFERLSDALDAAQIVELTFVVGQYTMLSMVANATAVPLEARLPAMPTKRG